MMVKVERRQTTAPTVRIPSRMHASRRPPAVQVKRSFHQRTCPIGFFSNRHRLDATDSGSRVKSGKCSKRVCARCLRYEQGPFFAPRRANDPLTQGNIEAVV